LLFDVTAILSTSAIDSVAEAFTVPAHSPTKVVAPAWFTPEQTAWARAIDVPGADLPSSSDPQLVPEQYRPSTLADLVASHAAATDVANWWAAAGPAQRSALLASSP
jgi:hypothetical protein